MNTKKLCLLNTLLLVPVSIALADVGFTKEELELVKDACLAGSSFDFSTEADGSISVKNLEGKGKLHISNKRVDTVDLPDGDKKAEFSEIRSCIKDYLMNDKSASVDQAVSRTCRYTSGPKAGKTQYFPPSVPIIPAAVGQPCQDGQGSWGVAIEDR